MVREKAKQLILPTLQLCFLRSEGDSIGGKTAQTEGQSGQAQRASKPVSAQERGLSAKGEPRVVFFEGGKGCCSLMLEERKAEEEGKLI